MLRHAHGRERIFSMEGYDGGTLAKSEITEMNVTRQALVRKYMYTEVSRWALRACWCCDS